jgi:hypothetical protein|tara:strand:+ start:167 stop:268 length:102 start_codon:yes stop_codon:yes gene_type:complete
MAGVADEAISNNTVMILLVKAYLQEPLETAETG